MKNYAKQIANDVGVDAHIDPKSKKGITLIALVITIIVLLILAGVALSLVMGENGITERAVNAGKTQNMAGAKEKVELDVANYASEFYQAKYVNGNVPEDGNTIQSYIMKQFDTRFPNGQPGVYDGSYTLTVNKSENEVTLTATKGSDRTTATAVIEPNGKVVWGGTLTASAVSVEITVNTEDPSKGTVDTTVNGTYEGGTKIALTATPASGYKLDGWYIGTTKQTLDSEGKYTVPSSGTTGVALLAKFVEAPPILDGETLGTGYYIQKGTEYALIFADRLAQEGNTLNWSSSNTSSFTMPTLTAEEKANMKTYVISNETYTDPRTVEDSTQGLGTKQVIKVADDNTGTEDRFYAMALSDVTANTETNIMTWYNAAFDKMSDYSTYTSKGFGTGKENTKRMIARFNKDTTMYSGANDVDYGDKDTNSSYKDMWGQIQTQVSNGWFVPSFEELVAFVCYIESLPPDDYWNRGLGNCYGSSSQSGFQRRMVLVLRLWHDEQHPCRYRHLRPFVHDFLIL